MYNALSRETELCLLVLFLSPQSRRTLGDNKGA